MTDPITRLASDLREQLRDPLIQEALILLAGWLWLWLLLALFKYVS